MADADVLIAKVNNGDGELITENDLENYKNKYIVSSSNIIIVAILMILIVVCLLLFVQINRKSFAGFDSGLERVLANEPGVKPEYASSLIYLTGDPNFVYSAGGKRELSQAVLSGKSLMVSMYGTFFEKPEYNTDKRFDRVYKPGLVY